MSIAQGDRVKPRRDSRAFLDAVVSRSASDLTTKITKVTKIHEELSLPSW